MENQLKTGDVIAFTHPDGTMKDESPLLLLQSRMPFASVNVWLELETGRVFDEYLEMGDDLFNGFVVLARS